MGILTFLLFEFLNRNQLPVLGPKDFSPELVDSQLTNTENGHLVSDFSLINQNGLTITQETYANKIYVTDFFFTRCPSICPIMSNNMEALQETFIEQDEVMFLSMSVTPELDSVPVLKKYADRHGVIDSKWNITTGDKSHIYDLARKSYFAVVDYGDGGLQDFIHTPNFILVDQQKQIRGVYNGTASEDIERLKKDIESLLQ
ncbi:SCO family protein [Flagellimonas nanhaiensis]|uniref:SCO family protein n=2 Tax=Flagellimonas nanhaiensis TaxID=2292706 RepID=A0A371JW33_9FLAO|nr:SCO family protein [Allomuricauda nanhaiensis]